ncbi:MAG: beta-galactosidase [Lentisphaeria bacterium]|nr:beta-galactosidase [Lentisphaeria bacterium]
MKSAIFCLLLVCGILSAAEPQQCAVFSWANNQDAVQSILSDLQQCGEAAILVTLPEIAKLSQCDLLLLPAAEETPLVLWQVFIPEFLARGGHLITDGHPERTLQEKDGKWVEAPAWIIPLAGAAHCVADFASFNYKGFNNNYAPITLKQDDGSKKVSPFEPIELTGIRWASGRSLHKCQWRLTSTLSPGKMEFHDCQDVSPIEIIDSAGNAVAQHTALVRHWCDFFPGSTVVCADIAATLSKNPSLKLLHTDQGPKYLKYLITLCRSKLPSDPTPEYYQNLKKLKKQITAMKDRYTEAIYLQRDLIFHSENNRLRSLPIDTGKISNLTEEFSMLEKASLEYASLFAKFRFNRRPFAVKRKESLLAEVSQLLERIEDYLEEGTRLLSVLAPERSFELPARYAEKGVIDIKYSCADYHPVSWFAAPPLFVEYENGRTIASTGVRGGCLTNYSLPSTYRLPTPEQLRYDESAKEVYRAYVKATGLDQFTSHEINSAMLPEPLCRKVIENDTPYLANLRQGTLTHSKNPGDILHHLTGYGIISSATETPEFQSLIEFMAARTAGLPGVHTRSITHEGMALGGYSEFGFAKYRQYLKKIHGDLKRLNQLWGTNFENFEQISPPRTYATNKAEQANMFDWISFRSEAFLNYMKTVSATYRRKDPGCVLTGCINQVSPLDGVEFYRYNQYLDFAAAHNTPTSRAWYQIGLGRRGQLADNNEPKWISYSGPWQVNGAENEYQKSQRFAMFYYTAQGMGQFAPYEWRVGGIPLRMGEYDGTLNLTGTEIKHFIKNKNRWQHILGAGIPRDHAHTGLYWSFVTKSQARGGLTDTALDQSLFSQYFRLFDRWNELLDHMHIPYEMITRDKMSEDLSRLDTLIVPQAAYLQPETGTRLLEFARQGKQLILIGLCGAYDPYKNEDGKLFDACGIVPIGRKASPLSDGSRVAPLLTVEEFGPASIAYESMEPEKTRVILRYDDGTPAAISVPFGKGEIIYCGFSMTGFADQMNPIAGQLLAKPLAGRFTFSKDPAARLFTWQGDDDFRYVFVLNHSDTWKNLPISFAKKVLAAYDIESGAKLNFSNMDSENSALIPVFPAGGRAIAVKCEK